ncbi:protein MODIFYING WALL LIGNIN-2-like isoform X2 [Macadamia integrifolia]|uniref:protein MODIFYING WALL LIGNIN-2-like isoform X2 n=1 Tax=Macadamia integrifolia TaxID=60698 RepID=UPI001C4F1B7B|nr:protein MODIFYING WALL LIGNIN-2-like isoform X2 [Macadamia integrifolia]
MEKNQPSYAFSVFCSIFISLGLVAFSTCIAAEFKRIRLKDMKLDGELCFLPRSSASGLGLVALICLLVAQIIGNLMIGSQFCLKEKKTSDPAKKQWIPIILLVLSWISSGLAIILLGTAISMSHRQPYGKGWLDGDCYFVRRGVYSGSGALVLVSESLILGSVFTITRTRHWRKKVDQEMKVNDEQTR